MELQKLKLDDAFKFSEKQQVRTTTYSDGEKTIAQMLGRGTTGIVTKVNEKSVQVLLHFRDKDRDDEVCTLRFQANKNVSVEKK